ncbi:MAG TPA: site-specific integrase [Kofleriaceae bacterium]|nr:site-specific integrase [Kofleriaceae bacterium]
MSSRRDPRTGRWFFRKVVTAPDGTKRRLFGVPDDYGQPNTRAGSDEAERLAIAKVREAGSARIQAPSPSAPTVKQVPTVEEFAKVWLAKSAGDDKPSTHKQKQLTLKTQLLPRFGKLRLDEITYALVEAWRLELLQTMEPSSVSRLMTNFRSLIGYAHKLDVLDRLPRWPTQRVVLPAPAFLSFEETSRLIAAAEPMDPWKAMVIVAVRTGLRHGELTALRWQDVDLAAGKLWVNQNLVNGHLGTPKSGHGREVPLSNDAIAALRAIRHQRGPLVFCSKTGRAFQHWVTDNALRIICRHAGMLPIGWHRLRHTFASHLATRGVSLQAIQELLGHANLKMTMRYAHLMPQVKRDAVNLLDGPPPAAAQMQERSTQRRRHRGTTRIKTSTVAVSTPPAPTSATSDPPDRVTD